MGCGEATAIRMMLAATGFVQGPENIGIVAATGLQYGLRLDLSVQSLYRPLDELAVRKCAGGRHGHSRALGSARLGVQKTLGHRRRWRDVRHWLSVA